MLKIGDKAPDFLGIDEAGNKINIENYKGKKLIVYFYPKDSTPGCTAEACSLRDGMSELADAGYAVVGISADSMASHNKFKEKQQLNFPLIADTNKETIQAFGAWGEKKMCGKTCIGTLRKTFVFDEQGTLVQLIEKVDTKNHADQLLS